MKYRMLFLLLIMAWGSLGNAGKLPPFNMLPAHSEDKFQKMHEGYLFLFELDAESAYRQHQDLDREGIVEALHAQVENRFKGHSTNEEKINIATAFVYILQNFPSAKGLNPKEKVKFQEFLQKCPSKPSIHPAD